ncbi:PAN2-PAN3 deadenylation complex subunit PAN3 [Seminavis robusta]|uniref:PAN2-PAN3 deadenylation complex subunit PAN3 n=1 Tax=Seminavis robusta TaxID=568900 RepID=A0A9N8ECH5_9STRA|nr:PAN2-PAN3 deadenylation complex subunit PAN3 [Seminavis robusta]|eukprot:Sro971_g226440.1 PAN2-PAN3 deadenylation complex subunit PAN3 (556) ;mRNA; f:8727-10663
MDTLGDSFGRLSTDAQEFVPGSRFGQNQQQPTDFSASQQSHAARYQAQSGLNATGVKEFVPGKAWSSGIQNEPSFDGSVSSSHQNQQAGGSTGFHSNNANSFKSEAENVRLSHQGIATVPAAPTPPPLPSFRALHSMTLSDTLWLYYRDLALEAHRQMEPGDPRHNAVPLPYGNAYCLSENKGSSRSSFGYPSDTFQATSREDGNLYCVRRFDNVRCVSPRIAITVMEKWNSVPSVQEHPGVVPFYRCFVAQRAVFFVHQYIPGARTLRERLEGPLLETVAWSAIVQLISAVRAVHTNNMAVRALQLNHILSNTDATGSRLRLRLNCLGVLDALEFEARKTAVELQGQDIRDLGRIILSITTGSEVNQTTDNEQFARCEAFLAQNYSRDLHGLTMTLIKSARPPSILEVSRAVAQRALDEQDAAYVTLDKTETALSSEYESGRAIRLMLKLAFVNERPEFGPNRRWSQSGDCYVLSLFRDFVFHQADGNGNPVMDLGHVTTALNKLDTQDEEKIALSSRDGKSLMVVSYADVARCLDSAYSELCQGAVRASSLLY